MPLSVIFAAILTAAVAARVDTDGYTTPLAHVRRYVVTPIDVPAVLRSRRQTGTPLHPTRLSLRLPLADMAQSSVTVDLALHRSLIAPEFRLVSGNKTESTEPFAHCYYSGRVRGQDPHKPNAAVVATCNGEILGVLTLNGSTHHIEPARMYLKHRAHVADIKARLDPQHAIASQHVVYRPYADATDSSPSKRRACALAESSSSSSSSSRTATTSTRMSLEYGLNLGIEQQQQQHMGDRRRAGTPKLVEVLLVTDVAFNTYHQVAADADKYATFALAIANARYADSAFDPPIELGLKQLSAHRTTDPFVVVTDEDMTLDNFCDWQMAQQASVGHDNAVLITRVDLMDPTIGYAPLRSMCSLPSSCSINEDTGLVVGDTVAHEMGHNFGSSHDGSSNTCNANNFVMSSTSGSTDYTYQFSSCSVSVINARLSLYTCLDNIPTNPAVTIPSYPCGSLPGQCYDLDDQCVAQKGVNYQHTPNCPSNQIECKNLWCGEIGSSTCSTSNAPTLNGSPCGSSGSNKVCMFGECVDGPTNSTPVVNPVAMTPSGGIHDGSVAVSLETATPLADIYYTLDGSTPTQSSTLYTDSAFTLQARDTAYTVSARAFRSAYTSSSINTKTFDVFPAGLVPCSSRTQCDAAGLNTCEYDCVNTRCQAVANTCAAGCGTLVHDASLAAGSCCRSACACQVGYSGAQCQTGPTLISAQQTVSSSLTGSTLVHQYVLASDVGASTLVNVSFAYTGSNEVVFVLARNRIATLTNFDASSEGTGNTYVSAGGVAGRYYVSVYRLSSSQTQSYSYSVDTSAGTSPQNSGSGGGAAGIAAGVVIALIVVVLLVLGVLHVRKNGTPNWVKRLHPRASRSSSSLSRSAVRNGEDCYQISMEPTLIAADQGSSYSLGAPRSLLTAVSPPPTMVTSPRGPAPSRPTNNNNVSGAGRAPPPPPSTAKATASKWPPVVAAGSNDTNSNRPPLPRTAPAHVTAPSASIKKKAPPPPVCFPPTATKSPPPSRPAAPPARSVGKPAPRKPAVPPLKPKATPTTPKPTPEKKPAVAVKPTAGKPARPAAAPKPKPLVTAAKPSGFVADTTRVVPLRPVKKAPIRPPQPQLNESDI